MGLRDFLATTFGSTPPQQPKLLISTVTTRVADSEVIRSIKNRNDRRDLLYGVVRDTMVKAGILSSSYRFKLMSLDTDGTLYSVMVDIAQEYGVQHELIRRLENELTRSAFKNGKLRISGVYWRSTDTLCSSLVTKSRPSSIVPFLETFDRYGAASGEECPQNSSARSVTGFADTEVNAAQ